MLKQRKFVPLAPPPLTPLINLLFRPSPCTRQWCSARAL